MTARQRWLALALIVTLVAAFWPGREEGDGEVEVVAAVPPGPKPPAARTAIPPEAEPPGPLAGAGEATERFATAKAGNLFPREMMTVYSIVNSLAINFPQIKQVQILIDGKPIESIAGHLSLKQPIPPKPDLTKRQSKDNN